MEGVEDRNEWRGQLTDAVKVREYLLAGNATLTLVSERSGVRYTYQVRRVKNDQPHPALPGMEKPNVQKQLWFVSLLAGPNNENDFVYLGVLEDNVFRLTRKSRMTIDSAPVKAFAWMWDKIVSRRMPKDAEIWHEGRCGRCGRKLTVPSSIESGYGPECAGIIASGGWSR